MGGVTALIYGRSQVLGFGRLFLVFLCPCVPSFFCFWLRSSVVYVFISLIWPIRPHNIDLNFLWGGPFTGSLPLVGLCALPLGCTTTWASAPL